MPWADYECPGCPGLIRNHRFAMALGAAAGAPICEVCEIYMVPIPAINIDVKTDGGTGKGFQKFEVSRLVPTREGPRQVTEIIDSTHKLRAIERDSEQRYRDGEGEPLRFRAYAQGHSNMDVGSFGTEGRIGDRAYDSGHQPQGSKKVTTKRHGKRKPKITVAKGAGASPLG